MRLPASAAVLGGILMLSLLPGRQAAAVDLVGQDAFGDWTQDAPGVRRLIRAQDLPAPYETVSVSDGPAIVPLKPQGAQASVSSGFRVAKFIDGLGTPRNIKVAPNGDIFITESLAGRIRLLRPSGDNTAAAAVSTSRPVSTGPSAWPSSPAVNPKYLDAAQPGSVIRFPYGACVIPTARGAASTVVDGLPTGGHWTRDIIFGPQQQTLFIAVGSATNAAEGMGNMTASQIADFESSHGRGAGGSETNRAMVLATSPYGNEGCAPWPPGCATARPWRSTRRAVSCGAPSSSATSWATTSSPT